MRPMEFAIVHRGASRLAIVHRGASRFAIVHRGAWRLATLLFTLFLGTLPLRPAGAKENKASKVSAKDKEKEKDPCGPEVKDAQQLAAAGLRIYREAQGIDDPDLRAKEDERSLRCYLAALAASQGSQAKIYHPLGLVLEKLGRDVEAVEAFQKFLEEVPETSRNVGVTKQIDDKLAVLLRRVGQLNIDTVPGLEVRVDERRVGRAPLGRLVVVTPGSHAVTVGDPGVGTLGSEVTVDAGQVRRVDLTAWRPRQVAGQGETPGQAKVEPKAVAYLQVSSNRKGAQVVVDDAAVGTTPLGELSLVPGPHKIVGRDGRQVLSRDITLDRNERRGLDLHFPVKTWVWVVTGVAAAAVVGTAVGVGVYYGTSTSVPDGPLLSNWQSSLQPALRVARFR